MEINDVVSKDEDLVEAQKFLDEYGVSVMVFYRDTNGFYDYLESYGRKVYDDQIVESVRDPSNGLVHLALDCYLLM